MSGWLQKKMLFASNTFLQTACMDSIVVSFVDDMGHRFDSHPISKANDSFLIQLNTYILAGIP